MEPLERMLLLLLLSFFFVVLAVVDILLYIGRKVRRGCGAAGTNSPSSSDKLGRANRLQYRPLLLPNA